jgi:hypothetical protein
LQFPLIQGLHGVLELLTELLDGGSPTPHFGFESADVRLRRPEFHVNTTQRQRLRGPPHRVLRHTLQLLDQLITRHRRASHSILKRFIDEVRGGVAMSCRVTKFGVFVVSSGVIIGERLETRRHGVLQQLALTQQAANACLRIRAARLDDAAQLH